MMKGKIFLFSVALLVDISIIQSAEFADAVYKNENSIP